MCRYSQGTDGRNTQTYYGYDSEECINKMPKNWDNWLPTNLTEGPLNSGRHLRSDDTHTHRDISLRSTATGAAQEAPGPGGLDNTEDVDGMFVSHRMPQDPSAMEAAAQVSGQAKGGKCRPFYIVQKGMVKAIESPLCSVDGKSSFQQRLKRARHAQQRVNKQCAVAAVPPDHPSYNDTDLLKVGASACCHRTHARVLPMNVRINTAILCKIMHHAQTCYPCAQYRQPPASLIAEGNQLLYIFYCCWASS